MINNAVLQTVIARARTLPYDAIKQIVITDFLRGSEFAIVVKDHDGKSIILIDSISWSKILSSFPLVVKEYDPRSMSPLVNLYMGIPVVEDNDLAKSLLLEALNG